MYVYLKPHRFPMDVAATKEVEKDVLIDYGKNGEPLGVEILSARKVTMDGKAVKPRELLDTITCGTEYLNAIRPEGTDVIPCTITYDDGTKPKRRRKVTYTQAIGQFSKAMRERMVANGHKKGWGDLQPGDCMWRASQEMGEITEAIASGRSSESIRSEVADAANFLMMLYHSLEVKP